MIGVPFEGSWDAVVDSAYYNGAGGEAIRLLVSIVLCLLALWMGHRHESNVNSD